jgi:YlmC/YmxH family sporulation protein
MRFFDCKSKEVINISDCKRLGYISDIEFEPQTGKIESLVIPGPPKYFGCIGREEDYVIPFHRVKQIGPDIILVDVDTQETMEKFKE